MKVTYIDSERYHIELNPIEKIRAKIALRNRITHSECMDSFRRIQKQYPKF